jgi:parallel beta-helix repeat protein
MNPLYSFSRLFHVFRGLVVMVVIFSQTGWIEDHASASPVHCYVDGRAKAGANDGTSWANAFTDLQSALGGSACTEIWVAAGIYKPGTGADRSATFQLKDGVSLLGGFSGTETDRDQRDPSIHPTLLSGDLNGDDVGFTNNAENVHHVITGATGASLDGFTITAGNANGEATYSNFGGGVFNAASSPTITNVIIRGNYAMVCGGGMANFPNSNPILTGVTFSGNTASPGYSNGFGGGMYNEESSPVLVNVTFTGNSTKGASGRGGGMYTFGGSPTLMDVTFSGNTASNHGGGLYNRESDMVLVNVTFSGNSASSNGGGMYSAGSVSPTLTNVTFSANSAEAYGGGMWTTSSSPTLTNVTFSGNTAGLWGGGMYNDASTALIRDTIFWGNSAAGGGAQLAIGGTGGGVLKPSVSDSVVQGGCPGLSTCSNILSTDPRLGTLGDNGGYTETIPLLAGSSAIDSGNDDTCAATDQRGMLRPQGSHCDMGAFEYQHIYWTYLPLVNQ